MRVITNKSSKNTIYYLADSNREGKKITTRIVEKIGTYNDLIKEHDDPALYAKEYARKATLEFKAKRNHHIDKIIKLDQKIEYTDNQIPESTIKNVGYLYLQDIYNQLGIKQFFKERSELSKISFNVDDINRFLTFSRILDPKSKKGTYDNLTSYAEETDIKEHQIYRFLDFLAKNGDAYQEFLYNSSKKVIKRDTKILYYDCTNFFFEIESEDKDEFDDDNNLIKKGLRKYGASKEHRPLPIVQMGLFMDTNGIPLAFSINHGSNNEQTTVKPLESKIKKDFKLSKFIYCADAGLGSTKIKVLNSTKDKAFIVTQSLKKLKKEYQDEIFKDTNWRNMRTKKIVSLKDIINDSRDTYYKEVFISTKVDVGLSKKIGSRKVTDYAVLDERIIITFQKKYQNYQRTIRARQINSAEQMVKSNQLSRPSQTSAKRFVDCTFITTDGEAANKRINSINETKIINEEKYDGFYAVSTNLEGSVEDILKISSRRWEIEESFRIMKTNFKARPVYLSRKNRIEAHFLTCFTALLIYRILEKKIDKESEGNIFTTDNIIDTLKNMNVTKSLSCGLYESLYKGSKLGSILDKTSTADIYYNHMTFTDLNKKIKNLNK